MERLIPWALAAASVAVAALGFSRGPLAVAALGFPGAIAVFFFMLWGRVGELDRGQVSRLGGQLFYGGGALVLASLVAGLFTLARPGGWWLALPLALLACPLLIIAALRLSTVVPRKGPFYGLVVALGLLGVLGAGTLVRLVRGGALPF